MNTLRWILAIVVVLAGLGFMGFVGLANGFRRSFGASENSLLIGIVPLAAAIAFAWWIVSHRAKPIRPEALSFPVLLVDENKIAEVCLNSDELVMRPENQDYTIEERFRVIDSLGNRYRIENYRITERKPSTFSRVFSATVYNTLSFRTDFDLRLERAMPRDEVVAQLRDRDWVFPDPQAELSQLYQAYRADRFKQYGNRRDRPLETTDSSTSQPSP